MLCDPRRRRANRQFIESFRRLVDALLDHLGLEEGRRHHQVRRRTQVASQASEEVRDRDDPVAQRRLALGREVLVLEMLVERLDQVAQGSRRIADLTLGLGGQANRLAAQGVEQHGAVDLFGQFLDILERLEGMRDAPQRGRVALDSGTVEVPQPVVDLLRRIVGIGQGIDVTRDVEIRGEQFVESAHARPVTSLWAPMLQDPVKSAMRTFSPSIE